MATSSRDLFSPVASRTMPMRLAGVRALLVMAAALFVGLPSTLVAGKPRAPDRVYPNPESVEPLAVGAAVPSARILTIDGDEVDVADLVQERGALLVFYRGGWCPYCSRQLGELRKIEDELTALGHPVVAISTDRPKWLQQSRRAKELGYSLYSDSQMHAARAFGIAWQVGEDEVVKYKRHGIDLEESSGATHHQLPVPSVFLVERGGSIRWTYSNPDHRVRPDNASLLEAVRRMQPPEAAP